MVYRYRDVPKKPCEDAQEAQGNVVDIQIPLKSSRTSRGVLGVPENE
jgi:hypothetical protein